MAVFTPLDHKQLEALLLNFELGPLKSFAGIEQGTVNSNYKVVTQQGSYVLTVLEDMDIPLVTQVLEYIHYLSTQWLPVVSPLKTTKGALLDEHQHKGITVCDFLPGKNIEKPDAELCHEIGEFLGRLHIAGASYPIKIKNQMGHAWRTEAAQQLLPHLQVDEKSLLEQILIIQDELNAAPLPTGMVHYDLFRDNVLIEDNILSGVLDFYYACHDIYIIDLSITLNDWCTHWDQSATFDSELAASLIQGYQNIRPLSSEEWRYLSKAMSLMAAHYWMSRLLTQQAQKEGVGHFEKDPLPFKMLLLNHISQPLDIRSQIG